MADFNKIVEKTFSFEGGFQQYTSDSANYSCGVLAGTNNGISAIALQQYLGRCVTENDVRAITKELAKEIYKYQFWQPISGDKIKNQSVAELMFATYIGNPSKSRELTKSSLKELGYDLSTSTPYSQEVVDAINKKPEKFHSILWKKKKEFLLSLADTYPQFINGWLNKHNQLVYEGSNFEIKKLIIPSLIGITTIVGMLIFNENIEF